MAGPNGGTPDVRLGRLRANGIAPSMFAIIERGVHQRPAIAEALRGRVVLRFAEGYTPVRMTFGKRVIRVEDGDLRRPDLAITGRLPDIVHLTTAPLRRGMPDPMSGRGRAALLNIALRRVKVAGDRRLARGLLALMAISRDPAIEGEIHLAEESLDGEARWIDVLT